MKHTSPISSVAANNRYIATGGYDNRVILWNIQTHKALARGMHDHLVNHCAFSSDGKWLVSASSDYSARIWALPDLKLSAVLNDHTDDVDMAVFSPDNLSVATCSLDRTVRIFDLAGRCLKTCHGHTGNIISLLWSTNGKQLVSSSVDGTVREWDTDTGSQLSCYDLDGVRTDTIAMDTAGRIIAGDDRGRIAIIVSGKVSYQPAHAAGIKKLVYCADRHVIATLSYDRTLAFWQLSDTDSLRECQRTTIPDTIWPRAADLLGKDKLVLGTFGSTFATYDWHQDSWHHADVEVGNGINAITCHQQHVYTVGDAGIVHKDGVVHSKLGSLCNFLLSAEDRLYSGGQLGQIFDVESGQVLYQHHSPINCGALFYRHQQPHIAIGTYTGEILIFSLHADKTIQLEQIIQVYENAIKSITTNHQLLFSVCASTDIAWHHCHDLSLLKKISKAHDKIVNACCTLTDQGFASIGRDRILHLWLKDEHLSYPSPHPNSVKCMAASTDGLWLITGSYTGTLALFSVAARCWLTIEKPTAAGISAVSYNPAKCCFLAASYDGNVYPITL